MRDDTDCPFKAPRPCRSGYRIDRGGAGGEPRCVLGHAVPSWHTFGWGRSWGPSLSICCMTNYRNALLISAALGLTAVAAFSYSRSGPSCAAFPGGTGAECVEQLGKAAGETSAADTLAAGGAGGAAPARAAAAAGPTRHSPHTSSMRTFGPIIRQPALGRHTGSVILLHGLGDTGEGAPGPPSCVGCHPGGAQWSPAWPACCSCLTHCSPFLLFCQLIWQP